MKAVEIIEIGGGRYGVRVYDLIVFEGSYEQCVARASQE